MKKSLLTICIFLFSLTAVVVFAGSKDKGDKCFSDTECEFNLECSSGVCTKKKEFDFGSSGKTGKPCSVDSDCIGSGTCEEGSFGKKYCTGR